MTNPASLLNARILIVDDQPANVRLLALMLGSAGYTCVTSTMDPHEVCELHRLNRYDLILLDLHMPGQDGYSVLEGLKALETGSYAPVLVITAHPGHKLRALQAGARDFVSKPLDMPEILLRVRNLLEVRLLHETARDDAAQMESLALQDPLTGLANRRLMDDRLWLALAHARRNKSSMALISLDLDGFKPVNDQLGHAAGDTLLKMVAERLAINVREEDTVARQGGDEFMLVLSQVRGSAAASTVAAKTIASVALPYLIDGRSVSISASAGISVFPQHGETADTLLKSADLALFEAKRAGKNTFRIAQRIPPSLSVHRPAKGRLSAPVTLEE